MENKRYSILLIAFDCHYSHVARFVKNLKRTNPLVEITLFADHEDISDEITENVFKIIYRHYHKAKGFIKSKLHSRVLNKILLYRQFRSLLKQGNYDLISIHFCRYYMFYYMRLLRKLGKKIVIIPWGSDVMRLNSRIKLNLLGRVYRNADMIAVPSTCQLGTKIVNEFGVNESKMFPLSWGSETIDYINEHLTIASSEAKTELGLNGMYVITCGYNAFPEQRHEAIIDAISKAKDSLPSNIVLLFPVTYGNNKKDAYVKLLKNKVNCLNLNAVFFENYLSVPEVFMLRRASDMFIHVQTTDAGNATIMEYVICGNKVLHGSWMQYKWMDCEPKFYFPINNLDELSDSIVTAYKSEQPVLPEEVVTVIKERGWSGKMPSWNEAFMRLLQFDNVTA